MGRHLPGPGRGPAGVDPAARAASPKRAASSSLEHTRFWLFPTYTHQQRSGIRPEGVAAAGRRQKPSGRRPGYDPAVALRRGRRRLPRPRPGRRLEAGGSTSGPTRRWKPASLTASPACTSCRSVFTGQPEAIRAARRRSLTPAAGAGSSWSASCRPTVPCRYSMTLAFRELLHTLDVLLNPTALA